MSPKKREKESRRRILKQMPKKHKNNKNGARKRPKMAPKWFQDGLFHNVFFCVLRAPPKLTVKKHISWQFKF